MRDNKTRVSNTVSSIPPSGIREFFDLVLGMKDVISLGVGEPDFTTPWHISETAIHAIEKGYTSYTSNKGLLGLRKAIADWYSQRYGMQVPVDDILITVGVSEGIDIAVRAILNPSDKVVVVRPSYVSYGPVVSLAYGKPVYYDTTSENGFRIDIKELEALFAKERPRAMIINYPCNPTGVSLTEEEVRQIYDLAVSHNVIILSDEIYGPLTYDRAHFSFLQIQGSRDNVVYFNGFSKAYAMTGWRIGYAIGPSDIIAAMTKIHQYTILCAPIMGQFAAIEAIQRGQNDVAKMLAEYRRRRDYFVARLNSIGVKTVMPDGAFYVFCDVSQYCSDAMAFAKGLLQAEKVAVVPGTAFSPNCTGFVRMAYASDISVLKEAADRIERYCRSL